MNAPAQLSPGLLLLLGLAGAGMPLFSDTVIATLPALQSALAANDRDVQQLVSLFVLAAAVMSLCIGALADAYGRRPLMLGSLLLLVLTSAGCVFSEHIEQLWVLRAIQGASACVGMILSRTIIRDLISGPPAQKAIGHISLIQSVFPVLAPVMGAWIAVWLGWRMVFACIGTLALLMLLVFARTLPESLPLQRRQPFRPTQLAQAFGKVFFSGRFQRVALAQALNWSAVFLYVATAPKFMIGHLGRAPTEMYLLFAANMLPMMLGFLVLPPLLRRHRPRAVLIAAYVGMAGAIAGNLAMAALDIHTLMVLIPIGMFSFTVGCTLPLLIGESLEPFPDNAGMASSCQMFLQYVIMGLTAGVVAPLAWHATLSLAIAQAGMVAVGFVLLLWQGRLNSQQATLASPRPAANR